MQRKKRGAFVASGVAAAEGSASPALDVQRAAALHAKRKKDRKERLRKIAWVGSITAIAFVILGAAYLYLQKSPTGDTVTRSDNSEDAIISFKPAEISSADDSGGWFIDTENSHLADEVPCDLPIIDAKDLKWNKMSDPQLLAQMLQFPFVIRGMMGKWKANRSWKRAKFAELYGDRTLHGGSESSIVYGGGALGQPRTVRSMLDALSDLQSGGDSSVNASDSGDAFAFDVSILKTIPELRGDFSVPPLFTSWDNPEYEKAGHAWHMLSLGPSLSGLPFHLHGETWLALLYGKKRWFIYPPGTSMPPEEERDFVPLQSMHTWLKTVYPRIKSLPTPPLDFISDEQAQTASNSSHFRPLECVQRRGDVLYLPRGYSHATLNVGETIGLGGQAAFVAERRLAFARGVLEHRQDNFEAQKAAGLALAHMAAYQDDKIKAGLKATSNGLVQLTPENFNAVVRDSDDTWLVQYYSRDNEGSKEMSRTWNEVAHRLRGFVSVGAMDITSESQETASAYGADRATALAGPFIVMFRGDKKGSAMIAEAVVYSGEVTVAAIADHAIDVLMAHHLPEGSVTTGGVKIRKLLREAEVYLRRAVELQPYQPEVRGLLAEVLGFRGDEVSMAAAVREAVALYDDLSAREDVVVSKYSLASVYHKIATVFLGKEDGASALPLLDKCLEIYPDYVAAVVDKAAALFYLKDPVKAEMAVREVERVAPGHPSISRIRSALWGSMGAGGDPSMTEGHRAAQANRAQANRALKSRKQASGKTGQ